MRRCRACRGTFRRSHRRGGGGGAARGPRQRLERGVRSSRRQARRPYQGHLPQGQFHADGRSGDADQGARTSRRRFRWSARFSLGGGNPMASDRPEGQSCAGIAMHFDLGNGGTTDLVMISAPMFVAKTPEQFVELLKTVGRPRGSRTRKRSTPSSRRIRSSTSQGAWLNARPDAGELRQPQTISACTRSRSTNAKGDSRRSSGRRAGEGRAGLDR